MTGIVLLLFLHRSDCFRVNQWKDTLLRIPLAMRHPSHYLGVCRVPIEQTEPEPAEPAPASSAYLSLVSARSPVSRSLLRPPTWKVPKFQLCCIAQSRQLACPDGAGVNSNMSFIICSGKIRKAHVNLNMSPKRIMSDVGVC